MMLCSQLLIKLSKAQLTNVMIDPIIKRFRRRNLSANNPAGSIVNVAAMPPKERTQPIWIVPAFKPSRNKGNNGTINPLSREISVLATNSSLRFRFNLNVFIIVECGDMKNLLAYKLNA